MSKSSKTLFLQHRFDISVADYNNGRDIMGRRCRLEVLIYDISSRDNEIDKYLSFDDKATMKSF